MSPSARALTAGWSIHQTGDYARAEAAYREVLQTEPQNANAWCYLGMVLHDQKRLEEAEAAYRRALAINPNFAVAWNNLGNTLFAAHREKEAIGAYNQALRIRPQYPSALRNKGAVLLETGETEEAGKAFRAALAIDPTDWECRNGQAVYDFWTGNCDAAIAGFRDVLKVRPDHAETHKNLGVALLLKADYTDGYAEYEWRIKDKTSVRIVHKDKPLWDGSPLAGRTLLIEAEQGMGDTIHFVRYAAEIKRQHEGKVVVAVEPQLVPLLTGIEGPDLLISQKQERPPFDVWAPLLSMPGLMKHDRSSFPWRGPYLKAEPLRVQKWKTRLADVPGLKIGIVWQGSKANATDRRRSFPLQMFAPLGKLHGLTLISLQKGFGSEQLEGLTEFEVLSLGDDFDASGGAFLDTAAVMHSLDLVISADTAVAHVAGALGVPVWVALSLVPDWRWTLVGDRTPWYPSMRLFRQTRLGDWNGVFAQMAQALKTEHPQLAPKKPEQYRLATSGFNRLARTRHGLVLYNRHDTYLGKSLEELGEFSELETDVFRQLLRPGSTIVEAGASIGVHTIALAHFAGESGLVHAIEPQRILFQTLCANVALNSLTNVHCHHAAAGQTSGWIIVPPVDYNRPNHFGGLSLGQYQQGERVPVMTIDSLQLSRCDLLKIDVEGMELAALDGARQTIKKFRPIVYIDNERPANSPALISALQELGYKLYWHLVPYYNPHNYYANSRNPFGSTVSVNLLCVHASVTANIHGLAPVDSPHSTWQSPASRVPAAV